MELSLTHKQLWFWLLNINGIGYKKVTELLKVCHTPEEIFTVKEKTLSMLSILTQKDRAYLLMEHDQEQIYNEYQKLEKQGIKFFTQEDKEYPHTLLACFEPPYGFYIKGRLPDPQVKSVAIVGARNCSEYGKEMALWFAQTLSEAGIQIISGLARGVDGFAHIGAIRGKTPTFGVLGCGINQIYPKEHAGLYEKVIGCGGIISEYGLNILPRAGNFPRRNRIIAGLCEAVLVIEAKLESGSLITVDCGLEQGKDIYAVPGRITDPLSAGCNRLIKMGAEVILSPTDLIEAMHLKVAEKKEEEIPLLPEEQEIVSVLSLEPMHYYEIASTLKKPVGEVMQLLILMELKDVIRQPIKNYYSKRR